MDAIAIKSTTITEQEIKRFYTAKRDFFQSGQTRSYAFRKEQLKKLKSSIRAHEAAIMEALQKDFRKPALETFATEIGVLYQEIDHTIRHLKGWMKPTSVSASLVAFPASAKVHYDPKGVVLILAPWNYPVNLLFSPLIGAMAAGCCAFVKPAEETAHTAQVIEKIITSVFPSNYISVVRGDGAEVVPKIMTAIRVDHVFFTGSPAVGKLIAKQAAEKLIPVTLELGGKSPAIICADANLDVAARRICFGKFLNAGQTCVAPDYLLVEAKVKDKFVEKLKACITEFYSSTPKASPDFARIVNDEKFERLHQFLHTGTIITGGETDAAERYIAPTLVENVTFEDTIMQEEIFGPILPILTFSDLDDAIEKVRHNPMPLAFYLFTQKKSTEEKVLHALPFGGGCVNQTIVHLGTPDLPFGGVGNSGLGRYHGRESFLAFSNQKGILYAGTWLDPKQKYPPYKPMLMKLLRMIWK